MLRTEAQAQETWCPFARVREYVSDDPADNPVINRLFAGDPDDGAMCLASRCMAWRWARPEVMKRVLGAADRMALVEPARPAIVPKTWEFRPHDPDEDTRACWMQPEEEARAERPGFCGLAGRVE